MSKLKEPKIWMEMKRNEFSREISLKQIHNLSSVLVAYKQSSRKNSSDEASTPAEAIGRSHSQQGSEGDVEHAVEAIATVQSELNSLEISQTQALTEILKKYKELKKPVYSRRQEAIKQVHYLLSGMSRRLIHKSK